MKHSLTYIALACMVAMSNAASITFNVIAPGATDVQVSVNGQQTKLTAKDADIPVFSGQMDAPDNAKYKYIVGGTAEGFDRTLEQGRTSTRNDFFNRPVTYANIPQLPWPIKDNPQWTRGGEPTALFDSNYIPTVFINGDTAQLENLVKNVPKDLTTVKFTLVDAEGVHSFNNVSFGIHGAGKKKNNAKQSWKWSLSGSDTLYNRNYFKLRHMEEDPTQMREKLYADVLKAMGSYGNEANMVRLFINGQGFGTFNLLDDVTQYSYINARWYAGKPPAEKGPLYDGASGASFAYSPTGDYYSFIPNPESPAGVDALDPVCKAFSELNYQDDAALANFEKQFEVDGFIRFMVMEYLAGQWDGYWMEQTNDGAYQDPTDKKWYYLGQDFDATFGVNLDVPEGKEFPKVSYTAFPQRYPGAVLINNLLKNANMKNKFETYLKDTVQVLFNNVTLTNRILAYHDFILPDLQWDRSIQQQSPGTNFGWTFEQVTQNLFQGVNAPNNNGGGASFGLIEWIVAKSEAVASEFKITITDKPVGPPNGNNNNTASGSSSGNHPSSSAGAQSAGSSSAQDSLTSGASSTTTMIIPSALLVISLVSSFL
ncbi:coth protein-domain-containing protein [Halteromyces radiatus]|uniref:coth protein-domain-containing protein n=1 Tax=Halteromyces radiatus TaxID=101107 RepID=UPI00221F5420|nr:coth protein-domain-containing protein [Halteromyces radiatus]KAI8089901.1 coth protein-domain-containing protein [Halteromyces radiatus]